MPYVRVPGPPRRDPHSDAVTRGGNALMAKRSPAKKEALKIRASKKARAAKPRERSGADPKHPVYGKSFAIFGEFANWPRYHGRRTPSGVVKALGGRVIQGATNVSEDLDFLVLGTKRGKGKTEAERRGKRIKEAGGKLEIMDEMAFAHMVRLDVAGKSFAVTGEFEFCWGGPVESQPPAMIESIGGVMAPLDESLDFLVVGNRRKAGKTADLRKLAELQEGGALVQVLNEDGFVDLMASQAKPAASGSGMDFPQFLVRLQTQADPRRIKRALKMLKKDSFQLYHDVEADAVRGVVGSQTERDYVYSNVLYSDGRYSCSGQDLHECMGLQGKVCKHLLVLLMGLTRKGEIECGTASSWIQAASAKRPWSFKKSQDDLAATLLRFKGARAGEVDWRPTETLPEDFMAF